MYSLHLSALLVASDLADVSIRSAKQLLCSIERRDVKSSSI